MSFADAARTAILVTPRPAADHAAAGRVRAKRMCGRRSGFTMMEIIIAIAIVVVLLAIAVPTVGKIRAAQKRTACIATLHQIAGAFHLYATDNKMMFPDPSMANLSWEQMLLRYFRGPYSCPSDPELFPVVGSSYDWRDTGDSVTTLAGRFLGEVTRSDTVLAFEALPGWHGRGKINAARMDNSVLTMDADQCFNDLKLPPNNNGPAPTSAPRRQPLVKPDR
jgi:prepilin-type N-terminal cleavage/methylation domain-containing protein